MKKIISFGIITALFFCIYAQSHMSTQSHQQQVNKILPVTVRNNDGSFYSASDDGFVIKWSFDNQGEHYQFSDVAIKMLAVSPDGNDIALYETDGGSINKVTVWDFNTFNRKYQKKFSDSITSLSYSSKGTYLIVGTATVDGAVFIRTNGWKVVDKIKGNTGIVSYVTTSESEKSCVFYSPSGTLSFYNMQTGMLKQKLGIVNGLNQTVMFNQNKLFAGVKDNSIYVTAAGKTISKISAQNPIILSSSADYNLYYLENDGRSNYEIKMLENLDEDKVSNPRTVKTMKGPRGSSVITTACKDAVNVYLGGRDGAIYKTEVEPSFISETLNPITENTYSKIYGMAPSETDFYFLTASSIYQSSYDTGVINKLYTTNGQNRITKYKDGNVILWSKSDKMPVIQLDLDKKTSKTLYTPKNNVEQLRICTVDGDDFIVEVESNGSVYMYDFQTEYIKEVYTGTGIQDAVYMNDRQVYVAKSASTNPKSPLLSVNPETLETVPVNIKGNVIYALSADEKTIYGINVIQDDSSLNTYVFSYETSTKRIVNILKFPNEDSEAFTYLNGTNLFTNIGRKKVYCYNLNSKKRFAYNRSASIPQSIVQNGNRVVILNNNGSISWCGPNDQKLLADWYLTKDEQWYEF